MDKLHDILIKEQMIIAYYVNKKGNIIEHSLGIVHISDTTTLSLNMVIDSLFCKMG